MERNYFSILFFIRRTRLLKNGEAPIGLRITVNGQRAELQIQAECPARALECPKRMCHRQRQKDVGAESVSGIRPNENLSDSSRIGRREPTYQCGNTDTEF
jgi:hypothetical protein